MILILSFESECPCSAPLTLLGLVQSLRVLESPQVLTAPFRGLKVFENHSNLCMALKICFKAQQQYRHKDDHYTVIALCNGVEWSKDRTQAAESIKWRPQQAYGSNQFLLAQPQTVFSTHKIVTLTHR